MKHINCEGTIEVLKEFIKGHKQYRGYDVDWGVVSKVYNRGIGIRDMARVHDGLKVVYVVNSFVNKSDLKHIRDLVDMLGGGYKIENVDACGSQLKIIYPK